MYPNEINERELQKCHTCNGKGIVMEVKTIQYKRI
jgi:Ribonuclease G/E